MRATLLVAHDTQCDDLATPHTESHAELGRGVEHGASEGLRLLWEAVTDNDEANGEQHVYAEGREDLRPEGKVPVVPGWVEQSHDEWTARADEGAPSNEVERGDAVHECAYEDVYQDAHGKAGK